MMRGCPPTKEQTIISKPCADLSPEMLNCVKSRFFPLMVFFSITQ